MTDPTVARVVELTCRHLAIHTGITWEDWLGDRTLCEVCQQDRTICAVRWLSDD